MTRVEERPPSAVARALLAGSLLANRHGIYLGRRSARIHVAVYRRTSGRIGGHLPGFPNAKIVLVDHVGAKTGIQRTSPLMFHEQDGVVAVVASKAGQATHPAWFHNLRANPETQIQIGREVRGVHARIASDRERGRLWPRFTAFYPGFDRFAQLAGDRRIPVMIFEPPTPTRAIVIEPSGRSGANVAAYNYRMWRRWVRLGATRQA